jgi:hypothetical protein
MDPRRVAATSDVRYREHYHRMAPSPLKHAAIVGAVAFLLALIVGCDGRDHAVRPDARASLRDASASEASATGESLPETAGDASTETAGDASTEGAGDSPAAEDGLVDSAVDVTPTGAGLGEVCVRGADCSSGQCSEGVCCDSACAARCRSCLGMYTGGSDGTCGAVRNGLSHARDCLAADATTCGFDGRCDGAGACRFMASGFQCQTESCVDGKHEPSGYCDGAGVCQRQAPTSCGNYTCASDHVRCSTSCGIDAECAAEAHCTSRLLK